MEPLFRVGGAGSAALVLGLLGGYPIGAKTAGELYLSHALSRQEAERLLAFCNNCNPVFLISVLGAGVFGSVRTGVWLLLIHIGSALLVGLLFRRGKFSCSQSVSRSCTFQAVSPVQAFVSAVDSALRSVLSVCAFVTFFYVLSRPLSSLGGPIGAVLVGMTELFSLTPLLTPDRFGFILAAGATGWGGLSVLCQTAAALEGSGLRLRYYLAGKALQGLFSALLAAALSGYVLGLSLIHIFHHRGQGPLRVPAAQEKEIPLVVHQPGRLPQIHRVGIADDGGLRRLAEHLPQKDRLDLFRCV